MRFCFIPTAYPNITCQELAWSSKFGNNRSTKSKVISLYSRHGRTHIVNPHGPPYEMVFLHEWLENFKLFKISTISLREGSSPPNWFGQEEGIVWQLRVLGASGLLVWQSFWNSWDYRYETIKIRPTNGQEQGMGVSQLSLLNFHHLSYGSIQFRGGTRAPSLFWYTFA